MRDMANSITIKHQYSLLRHNTFGLDVKAKQFINYSTVDELVEVLVALKESNERILQIGSGSNLLFTKDFEGTVLHSGIKFVEEVSRDDRHIFFRVGSGVVWDDFCAQMARDNYYGSGYHKSSVMR
ncbi:MAG: FAD-binding protein [Muribaculaceae bacterium]|nr:FAD-binding protein [Muribaculaceae bacterium]